METPLCVALDVTPLAGDPTGIARAVDGTLRALCVEPGIRVSGWMLTGRRRAHPVGLPTGVALHHCPVPARLLHPAWERLPVPSIPASHTFQRAAVCGEHPVGIPHWGARPFTPVGA